MKRILIGLFAVVAVWGQGAKDFSARKPAPIAYASLAAGLAAGDIAYCTDCTPGTDPCTGSGSGSFVWKDSGGSHCGAAGGGGGSSVFAKTYWFQSAVKTNASEAILFFQGNAPTSMMGSTVGAVEFTNSGTDAGTFEFYIASTWAGAEPTVKINYMPKDNFPSTGNVDWTPAVWCTAVGAGWGSSASYTSGTLVHQAVNGGKRNEATVTLPTTSAGAAAGDFCIGKVTRSAGTFTDPVYSPGLLLTIVQ